MYSAEHLVEAVFLGALGREADSSGLKTYVDGLNGGGITPREFARIINQSEEYASIVGRKPSIPDHSQFGELGKIIKQLMMTGAKHNIIVDVGARGRERSNSYDLMNNFGWRALLVEANPALLETISRDFYGLDFELVGCAVGPTKGQLPFYIGSNDDVSSLNKAAAEGWGEIVGEVLIEVQRLPELLSERSMPYDFDVLSIDIESVDVPVLNDLITTSPYRPSIIVIEVPHDGMNTDLKSIGMDDAVVSTYRILDYTSSNLILVLK